MGEIINAVRQELLNFADEEYRKFHTSLVPGLEGMLGVRMPDIRRIAKNMSRDNWQSDWESLSTSLYEELMIKGLLLGYARLERGKRREYLEKYIPEINNWAICDGACSTWHFIKEDPEYWFEFIKPYFESEREFEVRCAVVLMLDYFVKEEYIERLFEIFDRTHHEGYYVKMALAWAISVCYVKYPERTGRFLENNGLDDFVQNKAIQKIRESYRVSKEDKERLLILKR